MLRLGNWFTAADPKRGAPALPPQKGATGRRALRVQRTRAVGRPDRSLRPGAPQQLSRGDGLTRVCYTAEYPSEPLKACRHAARAHPGTGLSTPPGKRAPSGLGGCARRRASRCHAGDRTPPLCRGSTFNGRAPRAAPTERAAHAQPVHGARPPLADAGASHRSQSGPTNAPRRWQPAAARRAQRRPSLPQRGPLAPLASARRRQGTVRPPAYGWRGATLCGPRAVLLLLYRRYFLSPPAPSGASAPQAPPLACMRRERRDSLTAPSERPGGKPRSGAGPPKFHTKEIDTDCTTRPHDSAARSGATLHPSRAARAPPNTLSARPGRAQGHCAGPPSVPRPSAPWACGLTQRRWWLCFRCRGCQSCFGASQEVRRRARAHRIAHDEGSRGERRSCAGGCRAE